MNGVIKELGRHIHHTAVEFMAAREGITVEAVMALLSAGHPGACARYVELTMAAVENADSIVAALYDEVERRQAVGA